MKKIDEIKKMDSANLRDEINEFQGKLFKIRFEVTSSESKSTHLVREYKKYIARLKTALREKELEKSI